jgi:hypothetical protein
MQSLQGTEDRGSEITLFLQRIYDLEFEKKGTTILSFNLLDLPLCITEVTLQRKF